jgi:lysophospholipase
MLVWYHQKSARNALITILSGTLRLFPGITASTVRAFLAPPIQGLVLETFGAGNAPQRKDLKEVLKEACDRGVIVVAISQCSKGSVSAAYETGRALQLVGVLPGGDMTPEVKCAISELPYAIN